MKTLLIDYFSNQIIENITYNPNYNFLMLPKAEGIATNGQLIFYGTDSSNSAKDYQVSPTHTTPFCLTVNGPEGAGKVTVTGDFSGVTESAGLESLDGFASNWTGNTEIKRNYNLYFIQFNDDDGASGAIHFTGTDNKLVLTAQSGAENANGKDENIRIGSLAGLT